MVSVLPQPFMTTIQASGEVSLVFYKDTFIKAVLKKPALGSFLVQVRHDLQAGAPETR